MVNPNKASEEEISHFNKRQVNLPEHKLKQVQENQSPQNRASFIRDLDIEKNVQLAQILFYCLTYIVTPALKKFMCGCNLLSRSAKDFDFSQVVRDIDFYRKMYPYFLDPTIHVSDEIFRQAVYARNVICHMNLTCLSENWEYYLYVWAQLLRSIGNPEAADDLHVVYNYMIRGQYRQAMHHQTFLVNSPRYNERTAIGMGVVLYGCLSQYLAPALRNFLINKKGQSSSTSFDVFVNLKQIIEQQKFDSNYVAEDGWVNKDYQMLKLSMDARHGCCHGYFANIFNYWRSYLENWRDLLYRIDAREASAEMQEMLNIIRRYQRQDTQVDLTRLLFWLRDKHVDWTGGPISS